MSKKISSLILLFLLLIMSSNVFASPTDWPDGEPNMRYDGVVFPRTGDSVDRTSYGDIMSLANYENLIIIVYENAIEFVDDSTYEVKKTWLISDTNVIPACDSDAIKDSYAKGFYFLDVAIGAEKIFLKIVPKHTEPYYTYVNVYSNTLHDEMNPEILVNGCYTALATQIWPELGVIKYDYALNTLKGHGKMIEKDDGRLISIQVPGVTGTEQNGQLVPIAVIEFVAGANGQAQKAYSLSSMLTKTHINTKLAELSEGNNLEFIQALTCEVDENYAYMLCRVNTSTTEAGFYLVVIDMKDINNLSASSIVSITDVGYYTAWSTSSAAEGDSTVTTSGKTHIYNNAITITDSSLSGNYLYYTVGKRLENGPVPNTVVINITNPLNPTLVDTDIWAKCAIQFVNGPAVDAQTCNVFGSILVTTLPRGEAIAKTMLNSDKTQRVQELYGPVTEAENYPQELNIPEGEAYGGAVMVNYAKWGTGQYELLDEISLVVANKLYLSTTTGNLIKMTYTDPSIPDSTTVENITFLPNTIGTGNITTSLDYKIGHDNKGVTLIVARFEKTDTNDLRFVDVQFKSTANNISAGDQGTLTTDGFDIAANDASNTVLKAFVWNKLSAMMPYSGGGLPAVLGQ